MVAIDDIIKLVSNPYVWLTVGVFVATWLLSIFVTALVTEMPTPTTDAPPRYIFWFRVLHRCVGAINRAKVALKDPSAEKES